MIACGCAWETAGAQNTQSEFTTDWVVRTAADMDAILLPGNASGDLIQAHYYQDDIQQVREKLSPEGLAALDRIDDVLRRRLGLLTGPALADAWSIGCTKAILPLLYQTRQICSIMKIVSIP